MSNKKKYTEAEKNAIVEAEVGREAAMWRHAIASIISSHVADEKNDEGLLYIIGQDIVKLKAQWQA